MTSYRGLKDKTLKIEFETQEPTPETLAYVAQLSQSFGYLAFKKDDFKTDEIEVLESLKSDYQERGKSKSQRLKAVLYRLWEQKGGYGYEVFDDYYNNRMERLIQHFKYQLD